jgi:hypothetical protein
MLTPSTYQGLLQWHWDIGDRLAADQLLAEVPVVTLYPKNYFDVGQQMVQRMEMMLAAITGSVIAPTGKSGLVVVVGETCLVGASTKSSSLTFPSRLRVLAVESRRYNAAPTGLAPLNAQIVAAIIADNLQNFTDQGIMDVARPQSISADYKHWLPDEMRSKSDELDLVSWGLEIHSLVEIPRRTKVARPTITNNSATITIGVPAGATVKYSTNGCYPGSGGTAYSAPFAVTPPVTVRAVASASGNVDSDCVSLEVSS